MANYCARPGCGHTSNVHPIGGHCEKYGCNCPGYWMVARNPWKEAEMPSNSPFREYERLVRQTKVIAEVTPENIAEIARVTKGVVDYSGATPVLIHEIENGHQRKFGVGATVQLLGDYLQNVDGFNSDGTWGPAEDQS